MDRPVGFQVDRETVTSTKKLCTIQCDYVKDNLISDSYFR